MSEAVANVVQDDRDTPSAASVPLIRTGVLPYQAIKEMLGDTSEYGKISTIFAPIDDDQIQPASIDLRLGDCAYPIDTSFSFLPGKGTKVIAKIKQLDDYADRFKLDLKKGAVLQKGQLYVIPLQEAVNLKTEVEAVANPKSSTGRLDILTRLITDEGTAFDQVDSGYNKGGLYVEVVPRSFSVVVKEGDRLNQLRFRRTRQGVKPKDIGPTDWEKLVEGGQIINTDDKEKRDKLLERPGIVPFTIDLKGSGKDGEIIGWCAKKHTKRIDLERRNYEPFDFWEPIYFYKNKPATLVLDPNDFYILMTNEPVGVPPDYAAEMVAYDTRAGEFRVHYAGFFDPGFGWDAATGKAGSSRGVLEVRSHEVPFLLEHEQTVGWLKYERMTTRPDRLYGQGNIKSNYQGQTLKLAKQFRSLD